MTGKQGKCCALSACVCVAADSRRREIAALSVVRFLAETVQPAEVPGRKGASGVSSSLDASLKRFFYRLYGFGAFFENQPHLRAKFIAGEFSGIFTSHFIFWMPSYQEDTTMIPLTPGCTSLFISLLSPLIPSSPAPPLPSCTSGRSFHPIRLPVLL